MDGKRPETNRDRLLRQNEYDVLMAINQYLLIDGQECVLDVLRSAIPGESNNAYLGGLRFEGRSDGLCHVACGPDGHVRWEKPCAECIQKWLNKK
jgi:hypothetical protein